MADGAQSQAGCGKKLSWPIGCEAPAWGKSQAGRHGKQEGWCQAGGKGCLRVIHPIALEPRV